MTEALRNLFSSKKFLTLLVGLMVAGGAKLGLDVDGETAAAILGLFAVLIHAQGQADHGKEAAKTAADRAKETPPAVMSSSTSTQLSLLLVLTIGAVGVSQSGCDTLKDSGKRMGMSAIDCMQPALVKTATELKPTYQSLIRAATGGDGQVDWAQLRPAASALKTPALRCAFSTVVAEGMQLVKDAVSGVMSSPLQADPASLKAGYEAVRRDFFDGETYKLESGTL